MYGTLNSACRTRRRMRSATSTAAGSMAPIARLSSSSSTARLAPSGLGLWEHGLQLRLIHHDPPNCCRLPSGRVDLYQRSTQARITGRHVEAAGHEADGCRQDTINSPAQNALIRPRHANIADEGGAARQDL